MAFTAQNGTEMTVNDVTVIFLLSLLQCDDMRTMLVAVIFPLRLWES